MCVFFLLSISLVLLLFLHPKHRTHRLFIRLLCCHCFQSFYLCLLRNNIQWNGQSICAIIPCTHREIERERETGSHSTNNEKANKIPANLSHNSKNKIYLQMKHKTEIKRVTVFYNCQLAKSWEFRCRALLFLASDSKKWGITRI